MKNNTIFQQDNNSSINRVWIISDTHFGIKDGDDKWINIAKQWRNEFLIPTILNNAKTGDYLFHLGDVFDKRTSLNLNAINFTIETFEILSSIFASLNNNKHEIRNDSAADRMITYDAYDVNSIQSLFQKSKDHESFIQSIKDEFVLYPFNKNIIPPNNNNNIINAADYNQSPNNNNNIINAADYNRRRSSSNVKILVGNHDLYRKHDNSINAINILKWLPNVEIIYQHPKIFNLRGSKGVLVPWQSRTSDEQEVLNALNDIQFYFAHTSIQGALYSGRRVSDHGLERESYGSFKRVYTGHIHTTQMMGNVKFVGNPYEMTRNDAGNRKSILLVDFEREEEIEYENDVSPRWLRMPWEVVGTTTLAEAKLRGDRLDLDLSESFVDSVEVRNFLSDAESLGIDVTLKYREVLKDSEEEVVVYETGNGELPELLDREARLRIKNPETAEKMSKFLLELYKENL
jgi:hypothetical protein